MEKLRIFSPCQARPEGDREGQHKLFRVAKDIAMAQGARRREEGR